MNCSTNDQDYIKLFFCDDEHVQNIKVDQTLSFEGEGGWNIHKEELTAKFEHVLCVSDRYDWDDLGKFENSTIVLCGITD